MRLMDALALRRGDVVAFTGAGGKTSALARLASELAGAGWRVLATTTTRIGFHQLALFPASCSYEQMGQALSAFLDERRAVFWYSRIHEDKVYGIAPEQVTDLLDAVNADILLIEADGARRMPLKAPYTHEPVVPPSSTVIINIGGYSAYGQALDDDHVYNARGLAARAGVVPGSRIDRGVMVAALTCGAGGEKQTGQRFVTMLNGVPEGHPRSVARRIAQLSLVHPNVERAVIGAVESAGEPVSEVQRRICAVVLAAGLSRRMGQQKLLLPWLRGSTVIEHVIGQIRAAGVSNVLVVTGANADAVSAAARRACALTIHNPDYAAGEMLSTLQTGLRAAANQDAAAVLVVLGDQPSIRSRNVRRVLDAYAVGRGGIIAPSHAMRRGHPILIDRVYWQEILDLPAGSAPRDVINRHADAIAYVETDDSVLRDIDTPDAYAEEYRRAEKQ